MPVVGHLARMRRPQADGHPTASEAGVGAMTDRKDAHQALT